MRIVLPFLILLMNLEPLLFKPFQLQNYDVIYKYMLDKVGNYEYKYKTQATRPEDYIERKETGKIEKTSSGEEVLRIHGSYQFNPECDHFITVEYWADENGFKAKQTESLNQEIEKVDGKIVSISRICPVVVPAPIGTACIASLQGACAGK